MLCTSPLDLKVGKVACNQCMNCRINHKLKWLGRMVLEAKHWYSYAFITLTYDDDHLPDDGSVTRRDLRAFLEKLRRQIGEVRYFAVAEYGDQFGRPHYHVIHFGAAGTAAWKERYEEAWTGLQGLRGLVDVQSPKDKKAAMAYCLGYVTKKMTQKNDERLDGREPEFFSCSIYPPLGRSGLRHMARMMTTRQGAAALAKHGFPRGFTLEGQYYPLHRRDRHFLMKEAGYSAELDDHLQAIDQRCWFEYEEMELYQKAQSFDWSQEMLQDALIKMRQRHDEEEIEKKREQAQRRAEKRKRRNLALVKPPKDATVA